MAGIRFADPHFLWLLLLLPALVGYRIFIAPKKRSTLRYSPLSSLPATTPKFRERLVLLPFALRLSSVALIILALARPQSSSSSQSVTTEGIDIVLALDLSPSMLAEDLRPNRIEAAKKVALQFIDSRPNDRIGLVVFSGESFTQCPITSDHSVLKNLIGSLESGSLADGTAIGEGLATSINRIRSSKAKSKVVILLTDGVNNIGSIAPLTAGEIAKSFGVRVYTIGVGSEGVAPYPFRTPFGIQYQNVPVQIDEAVLKNIADITGGKYFRATSTNRLEAIYNDIDKLEKTRIDVTEFRKRTEEYFPFVLIAVLLLAVESLLRNTYLRILP
ncbi:MAG: vWA domain-containing protein [Bacteroidota bacterium]